MAASREEICRKYSFKDIKVAHWRDPYSAYVARAAGIPLVAADAYRRAYTPKYRLLIPSPKIPLTTDDEDSGVEENASDQLGDASVPEAAAQVELHSDEVRTSQSEPLMTSAIEPSSLHHEDGEDAVVDNVVPHSLPPAVDLTPTSVAAAEMEDTGTNNGTSTTNRSAIESNMMPSLDSLLDGLGAASDLETTSEDIQVEHGTVTIDGHEDAQQRLSSDECVIVEERSEVEAKADVLGLEEPAEVHGSVGMMEVLDNLPECAGEVEAPEAGPQACVEPVGGHPWLKVEQISPSQEHPDLTAINNDETTTTETDADTVEQVILEHPADGWPLHTLSTLVHDITAPAQDVGPLDITTAATVDQDLAAVIPTTPIMDDASLHGDDKHVSFAPDTPESKETKRKKKTPKEKDGKKSKRRSSSTAADSTNVGLIDLNSTEPADPSSSPLLDLTEEVLPVQPAETIQSSEDSVPPPGMLNQNDERSVAALETKAPSAKRADKGSKRSATNKASSRKSKSSGTKDLGLFAAGALLLRPSKPKSTKSSTVKQKDGKEKDVSRDKNGCDDKSSGVDPRAFVLDPGPNNAETQTRMLDHDVSTNSDAGPILAPQSIDNQDVPDITMTSLDLNTFLTGKATTMAVPSSQVVESQIESLGIRLPDRSTLIDPQEPSAQLDTPVELISTIPVEIQSIASSSAQNDILVLANEVEHSTVDRSEEPEQQLEASPMDAAFGDFNPEHVQDECDGDPDHAAASAAAQGAFDLDAANSKQSILAPPSNAVDTGQSTSESASLTESSTCQDVMTDVIETAAILPQTTCNGEEDNDIGILKEENCVDDSPVDNSVDLAVAIDHIASGPAASSRTLISEDVDMAKTFEEVQQETSSQDPNLNNDLKAISGGDQSNTKSLITEPATLPVEQTAIDTIAGDGPTGHCGVATLAVQELNPHKQNLCSIEQTLQDDGLVDEDLHYEQPIGHSMGKSHDHGNEPAHLILTFDEFEDNTLAITRDLSEDDKVKNKPQVIASIFESSQQLENGQRRLESGAPLEALADGGPRMVSEARALQPDQITVENTTLVALLGDENSAVFDTNLTSPTSGPIGNEHDVLARSATEQPMTEEQSTSGTEVDRSQAEMPISIPVHIETVTPQDVIVTPTIELSYATSNTDPFRESQAFSGVHAIIVEPQSPTLSRGSGKRRHRSERHSSKQEPTTSPTQSRPLRVRAWEPASSTHRTDVEALSANEGEKHRHQHRIRRDSEVDQRDSRLKSRQSDAHRSTNQGSGVVERPPPSKAPSNGKRERRQDQALIPQLLRSFTGSSTTSRTGNASRRDSAGRVSRGDRQAVFPISSTTQHRGRRDSVVSKMDYPKVGDLPEEVIVKDKALSGSETEKAIRWKGTIAGQERREKRRRRHGNDRERSDLMQPRRR